MYIYAQLDPENIVHSVARLTEKIEQENMIEIPEYDESLLGMRHIGNGEFEEVPEEEVIPEE